MNKLISYFNHPTRWAFGVMMLDTVSFGLVMPVMPNLLLDLGCTSLSHAALWSGFLSATFAFMQLIFSPLVGNLSDRFGRRPILLISLMMLFIDYLVKGWAHSIWILLIGRIICGITTANYSTGIAALADVSSPKDKGTNFGLLGTGLGAGFILGALLGGSLSSLHVRAPFFMAAFLAITNMIFAGFVAKETVRSSRPFEWKRANPFGAFSSVSRIPNLSRTMMVIFFYEISFSVYVAIWAFFTKDKFGWDANTIGISLGFFGVMAAFMQGYALRIFLARMGDFNTAIFALIINVLTYFLYAFASHSWMIFALLPLSALGTIFLPSAQSYISCSVKNDSQGELQGVVSSIRAIAFILGPLVMTATFNFFTDANVILIFPAAPFLVAMIGSVLALTILVARRQESNAMDACHAHNDDTYQGHGSPSRSPMV